MLSLFASLILGTQRLEPVVFPYYDEKAKSVAIAGDFNAWSALIPMATKGAQWGKSFFLPDNARIEYKIVVDGKWILDPKNPVKVDNGIGGQNSVWIAPKYRQSVHDRTPKHPMVRSELLVGGRTIVVYAPKKSAGLPVLIYGDGPSYEKMGRVQNVFENLVEKGKIRPAVIVLVPPMDRMKEYGQEWRAYGEYIFGQVLPTVCKATRASANANDTFMGGSSLGGLIALRLAEEFPHQLAGGIHCQSSSIQWSALDLKYNEAASRSKLRQISGHTRIWIDWGDFEEKLTEANIRLTKDLQLNKRPFGSKTSPEGHNWTAWRNRMEAGLIYLFGS